MISGALSPMYGSARIVLYWIHSYASSGGHPSVAISQLIIFS